MNTETIQLISLHRQSRIYRHGLWLLLWLMPGLAAQPVQTAEDEPVFQRVRTQFIAALAAPGANGGSNAEEWGIWRLDPGPRGVRLDHYDRLLAAGGIPPARWQFDGNDWWLEEHGLIMESPVFALPPGKYRVTGGREVTTVLTIHAADAAGKRRWELADGATLHDVTHLACRSARYTPLAGETGSCSPASARSSDFPVNPGSPMPAVAGCRKQDYAVLFVVGIAPDNQVPSRPGN